MSGQRQDFEFVLSNILCTVFRKEDKGYNYRCQSDVIIRSGYRLKKTMQAINRNGPGVMTRSRSRERGIVLTADAIFSDSATSVPANKPKKVSTRKFGDDLSNVATNSWSKPASTKRKIGQVHTQAETSGTNDENSCIAVRSKIELTRFIDTTDSIFGETKKIKLSEVLYLICCIPLFLTHVCFTCRKKSRWMARRKENSLMSSFVTITSWYHFWTNQRRSLMKFTRTL
jgi:hypothetical protein